MAEDEKDETPAPDPDLAAQGISYPSTGDPATGKDATDDDGDDGDDD